MKLRILIATFLVVGLAVVGVSVAESDEGTTSDVTGLQQQAERATPANGDPIPACPDEKTSAELLEKDIKFGPCMPFLDGTSEAERDRALEEAGTYAEGKEQTEGPGCTGAIFDTAEGSIDAAFPCGAKLIERDDYSKAFTKVDGKWCVTLEFESHDGGSNERRIYCQGADPTGEVVGR